MDKNHNKDHESSLEDIQKRKLQAEISKNQAETAKLKLETKELNSRISRKWYKYRYIIRFIIGGIVAIGLFMAWFVSYFQPVMSKKYELAELDNEIQSKSNEDKTRELYKNIASLRGKYLLLAASYDSLLIVNDLSDSVRERYEAFRRDAQNIADSLGEEIEERRNEGIDIERQTSHAISDQYFFPFVYFDVDKYNIRGDQSEPLNEIARILAQYPNMRIRVEGHTCRYSNIRDSVYSLKRQLSLSEKRAYSVKEYLLRLGISGDRIETVSYGSQFPVDPQEAEWAYKKSRRCEIKIISI